MWSCHKCGKPVYFAERKQSLGYDWHPECLRCDECGKRLNPGQHAEHKGVPYCDVPCYGFLFGPTLFGHGSQVESHTSFGRVEKRLPPGIDRGVLETKLKVYNQYYEGNSCQLKWKERSGKLVLEGVLRIYWGVNRLIHLKENEDQRHHVQIRKRNSYREAIATVDDDEEDRYLRNNDSTKYMTLPGRSRNTLDRENGTMNNNDELASNVVVSVSSADSNETTNEKPHSECDETKVESIVDVVGEAKQSEVSTDVNGSNGAGISKYVDRNLLSVENDDSTDGDEDKSTKPKREKVDLSHVQIRKMTSSRSKTKLKRRCSINGHFYNKETKTFKPPYGSVSNVWVTSMVTTQDVINMLLDKFCIENNPEEFALFIVRDNGEVRRVKEDDFPLLVRVLLGPHEEVVKVFIMDRKKTEEISNEVAQYLNFQEPELAAILRKFSEEEGRETKKIKLKYNEMRRIIKTRLAILRNSQAQQQPNGS